MAWLLIGVGIFILGVVAYILMFTYKKDASTVQGRADSLNDKFSTDMTRFAARKETKASAARTDLANQITNEMVTVIAMNEGQTRAETSEFDRLNNLDRLNLNLQVEKGSFQTLLDENELTLKLIGIASSRDMDVATYNEWKKKLELDKLDLDKQWMEAEQQLKAGFIFQLQAHQHLALMTEYIGKLYDRSDQLKLNGKDREHRLLEEHITCMERDFRGRQERLLQTRNEENIQGGNADTDPTGDGTEAVQATEE